MKLFRKSPVKNSKLQQYIRESNPNNQSLHLLLDCRTRWNSLRAMLKRFLRVLREVEKALIDFRRRDLLLDEKEEAATQEIVDLLETVEIASLDMSRNDVDLLRADKVITFTLNKMDEKTSPAGLKMASLLRKRFAERRNEEIAGLFRLLSSANPVQLPLDYPSKTELQKKARDLYMRLFWSPPESRVAEEEREDQEQPNPKRSKLEELQSFLQENEEPATAAEPSFSSPAEILAEIKREMIIFENTKKRPALLDTIFRALKTIPPTSVEAERAFSAAGLFLTKIRSRLSDAAIDNCCFLRNFLKNKN